MNGRYQIHRPIRERIFIEGDLVLDAPTHLGNGDSEGFIDMPLLLDELERRPLLTGASIAGALRSYLREYELGYLQEETPSAPGRTEQLFGCIAREGNVEEARLSWLMVDDALAERQMVREIRDGVSINPVTRTARDREKFDIELLAAGTVFPLRFELLVPPGAQGDVLIESLAVSLRALQRGEVGLGQRKRRGYGVCHVAGWRVQRYPMNSVDGLLGWLHNNGSVQEGSDIEVLLLPGRSITLLDQRAQMRLMAVFDIEDTLIIRSGGGKTRSPDMVHLRNSAGNPVIPGTTMAGVLRHRFAEIMNTIAPEKAETFISNLFGPRLQNQTDRQPWGSRVWVRESVIENPRELVHTRVMIDRFTGGALPQHLFSEQPIIGGRVHLDCSIRKPSQAEVGLFLLLLKDLWTGDLCIGGESSIGRGRLRGVNAVLEWNGTSWRFAQEQERLAVTGDRKKLEACVQSVAA